MKVKNIIIGKQFEECENLQKFTNLLKNKKINLKIVEAGTKINIEKNLHLEVLWPNKKQIIKENSINNNSLVFKLYTSNFSMLFTGDIEEKAEKELIKNYKEKLKSTAIKIPHHGSKSSSSQKFIEAIKPEIALIGVGENNKYNHPSQEIISRLKKLGTKIYRTDKNGETTITINSKGKIKTKHFCN